MEGISMVNEKKRNRRCLRWAQIIFCVDEVIVIETRAAGMDLQGTLERSGC
jgi:hypothetical protein